MFDMAMFDVCAPASSQSEDAIQGKWVRVPRNLNIETGMWPLVTVVRLSYRMETDAYV